MSPQPVMVGDKSPLHSLRSRNPVWCQSGSLLGDRFEEVNECNRLFTTIDIGWFGHSRYSRHAEGHTGTLHAA